MLLHNGQIYMFKFKDFQRIFIHENEKEKNSQNKNNGKCKKYKNKIKNEKGEEVVEKEENAVWQELQSQTFAKKFFLKSREKCANMVES